MITTKKGELDQVMVMYHPICWLLDAIIPVVVYRTPLELLSEVCLGESNTRLDDLLGSPRVDSF